MSGRNIYIYIYLSKYSIQFVTMDDCTYWSTAQSNVYENPDQY